MEVRFNAAMNILHFDYVTLHALEAAFRDNLPGGNARDPFLATLNGFENIQNISIPEPGNFTLLKYLRQSGAAMFNINAPPILRGVTYVEYAPGLPNTASTCQLYINQVTAEVNTFMATANPPITHWTQRRVVERQRDNEIAVPRIQFLPSGIPVMGPPPRKSTMRPMLSWAASAALNPQDLGQGVRAPRQGRY